EPRTEAGTQALLMEGMRRIDEMARLSDTLPLSTVLGVDFPRLLTQLAEMPDELNGVLRLFDGVRTVREVIAGSPLDELATMAAVQKLMSGGVLVHGAPAAPRRKPSFEQWLGSNPPPPADRAAAAPRPADASAAGDEELPLAEVLLTPPGGQAISDGAPSSSAAPGAAPSNATAQGRNDGAARSVSIHRPTTPSASPGAGGASVARTTPVVRSAKTPASPSSSPPSSMPVRASAASPGRITPERIP